MSVTVFDGPLLQRASTIVPKPVIELSITNLSISQQLPFGYTSIMLGREDYPAVLSIPFAGVMQSYQNRSPIKLDFNGCEGTCQTNIQAAGFAVNYSDSNQPVKFAPSIIDATMDGFSNTTIFSVDLKWLSPTWAMGEDMLTNSVPEQLELTVSYATQINPSSCSGNFVTKNCTLVEAVVSYPATLVNSTATLDLTRDPRVIALGNSYEYLPPEGQRGLNVTLGGFALAGTDLFGSEVSLLFSGGGADGILLDKLNTFASQYIIDPNYEGFCNFTFNDPTRDILTALHEIMFRTALKSSNIKTSVSIQNKEGNYTFFTQQPVSASRSSIQNVFQSHFGYLSGAIALITLGILSILPTYNGWRLLGREMTMSPIEIVKAFNAPMMETEPSYSNAPVQQLVKRLGSRQVRYGEVGIVQPGSEHEDGGEVLRTRLEMNMPEYVTTPMKGATF